MKLVEINWQPDDKQLRQFALICLVALPAIAWFWGASLFIICLVGGTGIAIAGLGLLVPRLLKPVFVGFSLLAAPIGLVVGELAMLLIYFGVFLPFGICFKLIGRDALQLKLDRNCKSYWQPKKQPPSADSYYRQS
jgi:hypothetical protein